MICDACFIGYHKRCSGCTCTDMSHFRKEKM